MLASIVEVTIRSPSSLCDAGKKRSASFIISGTKLLNDKKIYYDTCGAFMNKKLKRVLMRSQEIQLIKNFSVEVLVNLKIIVTRAI